MPITMQHVEYKPTLVKGHYEVMKYIDGVPVESIAGNPGHLNLDQCNCISELYNSRNRPSYYSINNISEAISILETIHEGINVFPPELLKNKLLEAINLLK